METYNNSFSKKEDGMLWELHEIRHKLYKEIKDRNVDQINKEAMKKFLNWKKQKVHQ